MIHVLALDLSLTATGVAWHQGVDVWRSKPSKKDIPFEISRLAYFERKVLDHVENYTTDLVVIESLLQNRANGVAALGMLHGVIRTALHWRDIPVALVPPSSLKKYATGTGNAQKPDMRMALYKRAFLDERDDNIVDAHWLYYMALDHYGCAEFQMPQDQRAALDKIEWPALVAA